MTTFIGLLRAVNVGGTGMLPMKILASMCGDLGFANVRTYIQSGNVVFQSKLTQEKTQTALERALAAHMGKKVDVMLRDLDELKAVLEANPFTEGEPAKIIVAFSSAPVDKKLFKGLVGPGGEQVVAGKEEVYIYYPEGMGRSKLKLPKSDGVFTARNINTVGKLIAIAEEIAATQKSPAKR
jgi:uncharacterized protein (DUF1697 family)